jgi:drug/metabolite transporter (DMT)-like permease
VPGWTWAVIAGLTFGISQISNRGVNRTIDALSATAAMVTSLLAFLVVATFVTGRLAMLAELTLRPAIWFAAAGLIHFLVGWTLFARSQQRIGPSRTASILSVHPVMAAIAAWLVLDESLRPATWLGVVAVTTGVAVVAASRRPAQGPGSANPALALAATACFSVSPLFARLGMADFDHPLVGLTVGMAATAPVLLVAARLATGRWITPNRRTWPWLLSGGAMAALAFTAQWTAYTLIPVGAAVALQQLNTPLVLFAGPRLLQAPAERITRSLMAGTVLIVGGAVAVALFGRNL